MRGLLAGLRRAQPPTTLGGLSDLSSSREAEAAIARIEQQVAEAQLRAERAQQVQVDIDAVRATATSPRREVSVTVDAGTAH